VCYTAYMSRIQYNREIVRKISAYLEAYPDIRFGQALVNLNIVKQTIIEGTEGITHVKTLDPFYEESSDTLKGMKDLGS